MKCEICDHPEIGFSWTDFHGVAQCFQCGAPYRIYHYEGEGSDAKRVNKPPLLEVEPEFISLLRDYWIEHKRIIPSGYSFPGGQELASRQDTQAFNAWFTERTTKYDR